jgi:hypothetical protein
MENPLNIKGWAYLLLIYPISMGIIVFGNFGRFV